ncbi:MAG: hypothetical protein QXR45_12995 [Candidatus Bathyarchaeia archaeon]
MSICHVVGFALSNFLLGYPHYVIAALTVNSLTEFLIEKSINSNIIHVQS